MTMKLIGTHTSPYVRKTRIVLMEKKIDYDFVIISPWEAEQEVARYNPLGKVPVLVLDDGHTLYDSRVIVEYLDNMTPNNRLIPASGRERITVKRWEALCDGLCDAATTLYLESQRPEPERSLAWMVRQRGKIERVLAELAEDLDDAPWCFGTGLSLSDVALGCALGYLDFRFAELDWRAQHAALARHYDKLMQRSSFAETSPRDG